MITSRIKLMPVRARSLLRIDGPSVAERTRAGCKEQRSAEYWMYSSERRRRRRPSSARHATPGGYAQQAPRQPRAEPVGFADSEASWEGLGTLRGFPSQWTRQW